MQKLGWRVKKKTKKGGNGRNIDGDDDDDVNYNILFHLYQIQ